MGGLLPKPILEIIKASKKGQQDEVKQLSDKFYPIWELFRQYGSLRVIATIAELMRVVKTPCLPLPLKTLNGKKREELQALIYSLEIVKH